MVEQLERDPVQQARILLQHLHHELIELLENPTKADPGSFKKVAEADARTQQLVDALLAYQTGPWRFALNAVNLADKVQITTCLARGDCFYGNRGQVTGSLSYRF